MFKVEIKGDRVIIDFLDDLIKEFPEAVKSGLNRSVKGIYREAQNWLNGPGAKGEYVTSKSGKKYWKEREEPIGAGEYPVPRRTGHLARAFEYFLAGESESWGDYSDPGSRKVVPAGEIELGEYEAAIVNKAAYALMIHEGMGTSRKYGRRPFVEDALERFNQGAKITGIMEEEINKAIKKASG